jgi:hypothetical protein
MHPVNKNLEQGTSGTLFAALDPSLESEFALNSHLNPSDY